MLAKTGIYWSFDLENIKFHLRSFKLMHILDHKIIGKLHIHKQTTNVNINKKEKYNLKLYFLFFFLHQVGYMEQLVSYLFRKIL